MRPRQPAVRPRRAAPSRAGRPANRQLPSPDTVVRPFGGEGPPYNYQAMVDYAYHYSINPVGYTRDDNDCTTFISWALWTGGYEEHGSDSYCRVRFRIAGGQRVDQASAR